MYVIEVIAGAYPMTPLAETKYKWKANLNEIQAKLFHLTKQHSGSVTTQQSKSGAF
jgi:hypothetical protein